MGADPGGATLPLGAPAPRVRGRPRLRREVEPRGRHADGDALARSGGVDTGCAGDSTRGSVHIGADALERALPACRRVAR